MQRTSGILLHPTAIPGSLPIGELGGHARVFVDFLAKAGQSVWQILPMGPTGYGHSPYNALSAFAGNPVLIDLQQLVEYKDLDQKRLESVMASPTEITFDKVHELKQSLLMVAGNNFFNKACPDRYEAYERFCRLHSEWLEDFSLFMAIKEHFNGTPWYNWPEDIRERRRDTLEKMREQLDQYCRLIKFQQFVFFEQWQKVKDYANSQGVRIFGDIPIFVAYDSADVWSNQHLFQLDSHGKATVVAGVPPDYFSKTGQRWGNPLYRWEEHRVSNFSWWLKRFAHQLHQCDLIRIDHFRGFQACWSIPANERTAVNGSWEEAPGRELFSKLQQDLSELPIVAEDLGIITPEVEQLRNEFDFPGMKILQFAFDSGPDNPYLPENHTLKSVVYTGTHDNATTLGWWQGLSGKQKDIVRQYLGNRRPEMPWELIRIAMQSVAFLCIIPLQDVLSLDNKARFNTPGRATGNWQWQFDSESLTDELVYSLRNLTEKTNRVNRQ